VARLSRAPGEDWKGQKPRKGMGFQVVGYRGMNYVRVTHNKRGRARSELHHAWILNFVEDTKRAKAPDPCAANYVQLAAPGTGWFGRDVILTALNGKLFRYQNEVRVTTPTVSVKRASAQALTSGVYVVLTPDSKEWDNNAFWSSATNPTRLTAKSSGLYLIFAKVDYSNGSGLNIGLRIRLNGTTTISEVTATGPSSYPAFVETVRPWYFHKDDYIELTSVVNASGKTAQIAWFTMVAITPEAVI